MDDKHLIRYHRQHHHHHHLCHGLATMLGLLLMQGSTQTTQVHSKTMKLSRADASPVSIESTGMVVSLDTKPRKMHSLHSLQMHR